MTHPMEEAIKLSMYILIQAAKGHSPFNVVETVEGTKDVLWDKITNPVGTFPSEAEAAGTVLWDKIWKPLG